MKQNKFIAKYLQKERKRRKDKKSSDEMRRRSIETFAETRKRKEFNENDEDKPKEADQLVPRLWPT